MQDHPDRQESMRIMDRECNVLLSEIERLEMFRRMQDMRLENLINLVRPTSVPSDIFRLEELMASRHSTVSTFEIVKTCGR